jgi:hypothetical protein
MFVVDGELFATFYEEITPKNTAVPINWGSRTGGFLHSNYNMTDLRNNTVALSHFSREEIRDMCEPILEGLKHLQICLYCKTTYYPEHNFGTYKCQYHPDEARYPTAYSCCNESKAGSIIGKGCTPCDHSSIFVEERWSDKNCKEKIPLDIIGLMKVPKESCEYVTDEDPSPLKNYVLVNRIKQQQ